MKVLLAAYACDPSKGSEPAVGWNWAKQAARFHEVWVMTRANNRAAIEAELARSRVSNMHFIYHDLPSWSRFWKRGQRGIHLYYLLWQLTAIPICRRLNQEIGFDVAHHVTFCSYRSPSCLAWLPCSFIWGPVAGAEKAPLAFYPSFGIGGAMQELLRDVSNLAARRDPFVLRTMRKAKSIITATEETKGALPEWAQAKTLVVPAIGIDSGPEQEIEVEGRRPGHGLSVLYVGRLLHWKGLRAAVRAFAQFSRKAPHSYFTLVGDGPERGHLTRLAAKLGLGSRVRFEGEQKHGEILHIYERHDVLLFPSLHDSGGFVPIEAMSFGLPVICLDLGGPAMTVTDDVGIKVRARSPAQTIEDLATALKRLAADPQLRMSMGEAGRRRAADVYSWDGMGELLRGLYASVASNQPAALQV